MTNTEFAQEFDVLYNNIMSNIVIGLNDYEKSVFLTKAQEDLVMELYNGSINGKPFDTNEEVSRFLNSVIKTYSLLPKTIGTEIVKSIFGNNTQIYELPADVLYIIYEQVEIYNNSSNINVLPINNDEFYRIKDNPFRGLSDKRIFRIDYGSVDTPNSKNTICLIYKDGINIQKYVIRVIAKPGPIILKSGLPSINNVVGESVATLPESLHRAILDKAIQMAKKVWDGVN